MLRTEQRLADRINNPAEWILCRDGGKTVNEYSSAAHISAAHITIVTKRCFISCGRLNFTSLVVTYRAPEGDKGTGVDEMLNIYGR